MYILSDKYQANVSSEPSLTGIPPVKVNKNAENYSNKSKPINKPSTSKTDKYSKPNK